MHCNLYVQCTCYVLHRNVAFCCVYQFSSLKILVLMYMIQVNQINHNQIFFMTVNDMFLAANLQLKLYENCISMLLHYMAEKSLNVEHY